MSFVFKIKLKSTNRFSFCVRNTETDKHIFLSCFNVSQLWKNINNWVFENSQIELQFNLEHELFGLLYKTEEKNMLILFCLPFLTVLLFLSTSELSSQSITTPL
jgi:hypothetical protein